MSRIRGGGFSTRRLDCALAAFEQRDRVLDGGEFDHVLAVGASSSGEALKVLEDAGCQLLNQEYDSARIPQRKR